MSNNYERFENETEQPPPYTEIGYASAPPHPQQQPPSAQKPYPEQAYPQQPQPSGYQSNQGQQNYPPPPHYGPGSNLQYPVGSVPPVTGRSQVIVNQVIVGNCPNCRVGNIQESFNICGIIMAILFFPIGLLCLLCMIDRKCSHCGFIAG